MPSVAPGAPRTIATSLTRTSLPRSSAPNAVRPDREDDDEDRHRDPRPLAPVEALEDEVVDRPDQQDVGAEQGDEAADRRQGERGQLRHRADELAVVAERGRPTTRAPAGPAARGPRSPCRRRASGVVGSKPMIVTAPLPYGRSAAIDAVAARREGPTVGQRAAEGRQVGRARRDGAEQPARASSRRRRPSRSGRYGSSASGKADRRARAGRPADDDEAAAAGEPAAQRRELVGREAVRSRRPARRGDRGRPSASTRSGRSSGVELARSTGATLVLVGQQVDAADDRRRAARRRRRR